MLYPLKFEPIYKQRIWGGDRLKKILNKKDAPENCGETWEISCVNNDISIVENGVYSGKSLADLIDKFKEKLLGTKVYEIYGNNFPLLIKFIDAKDDLSYQVHPNDEYAYEKHKSFGKTEMWYIIDADEGASLISGFNKKTNQFEFMEYLNKGKLNEIVNKVYVKQGDVVFIPAGRIHSTGKGILLAEIQQSSDITYRVWDFDRIDENGNKRELHINNALQVLDFEQLENPVTNYLKPNNNSSQILQTSFFNCNILKTTNNLKLNYSKLDSFIVLICVNGSGIIFNNKTNISVTKGETILIPADIKELEVQANNNIELLEVYID